MVLPQRWIRELNFVWRASTVWCSANLDSLYVGVLIIARALQAHYHPFLHPKSFDETVVGGVSGKAWENLRYVRRRDTHCVMAFYLWSCCTSGT
jgi:hypothetical protein